MEFDAIVRFGFYMFFEISFWIFQQYIEDIMNIFVAYLERTSNYSVSDAIVGEYRKTAFLRPFYRKNDKRERNNDRALRRERRLNGGKI